MTRLRWLILIFGPLPIVGVSWSVSDWFKPEPRAVAARNDGIVDGVPDAASKTRALAAFSARPSMQSSDDQGLQRACRQAAARLAQRAGDDFQVIVESPFVLGGDLSRQALRSYYTDTIAPATGAMQARYFRSRPDRPITVLLFDGEESYNRHAREWFGDSGVSIYGYYKPRERTLLANIATGGGTLLHELTHALIDFELSDPPDWLNEGLASLHEQCRFRSDENGPWIEGLVNWRLEGLQTVIRQGRLRSLANLVTEPDFRGPLMGTNYAQARYFCLYMQQQGVLERFFRDFRDDHSGDPDGSKAVRRAFDGTRWADLDRDFQRWALALSP